MSRIPWVYQDRERYLLIDINCWFFRHFCVMPDRSAKSCYDFIRKAITISLPDKVYLCADSKESFRRELYPEYKAQRAPKDPSMAGRKKELYELLSTRMDLEPIHVPGYEADDLIATLATKAIRIKGQAAILGLDKDFYQLLSDQISDILIWNGQDPFFGSPKKRNRKAIIDGSLVSSILGVGADPQAICDYFSLVGDSSDNIKGAKGIGPKKAVMLVNKYASLYDMRKAAIANELPKSIVDSILGSWSDIMVARHLVELFCDIDLPFDLENSGDYRL